MKTRITELLGIEHPIFQAAMSWACCNAPLVIAVSNAGGMGVLGAGPMRPADFRNVRNERRPSCSADWCVKRKKRERGWTLPIEDRRRVARARSAGQPVMVMAYSGRAALPGRRLWWSCMGALNRSNTRRVSSIAYVRKWLLTSS